MSVLPYPRPAILTHPFIYFFVSQQSWVGILLMKQPFLIAGIEDVERAKSNAFGAAGIFFFTFLSCVTYMAKESRHQLPPMIQRAASFGNGRSSSRRMADEYGEYGQVSSSAGGGYRDYPDEDEHAVQELPESLTRRGVYS